jgi:hypothetical protein
MRTKSIILSASLLAMLVFQSTAQASIMRYTVTGADEILYDREGFFSEFDSFDARGNRVVTGVAFTQIFTFDTTAGTVDVGGTFLHGNPSPLSATLTLSRGGVTSKPFVVTRSNDSFGYVGLGEECAGYPNSYAGQFCLETQEGQTPGHYDHFTSMQLNIVTYSESAADLLPTSFDQPFSVTLDPTGANEEFGLAGYDVIDDQPLGTPPGVFPLVGSLFPTQLTAVRLPSAAPEPASWAMMLAGFGLAGAALRRRRRLSGRPIVR